LQDKVNGRQGASAATHRQGDNVQTEKLKKILVVDDEPAILTSLTALLATEGVAVITCDEVEQAEAALQNDRFDLVIADIRMSGVTGIEGLELLSYIKERYATEVIIMTGYGTPEIEAEAYRRGALCFLKKPLEVEELLRTVSGQGIPVFGKK
jgi:DNA-binding NtrC family response regulator